MTKQTAYQFTVTFSDGSVWSETIESRLDTVWPARGFDYVEKDSKVYDLWLGDNLKIKELKEKFAEWVKETNPHDKSIKIKWVKVDLYIK